MKIAYIQYTNPAAYPPLEHSSRILASAGWNVLFLGTAALGADSLRFPPNPNVVVKYMSFCAPGFRQKAHYLRYCLWVLSWVIAWRPKWVYASDLLSCPVALILSLVPGLKIVYHEHDSPALNGGTNGVGLWARRILVRRVECSILPNEIRAQRFQADLVTGRSHVFCVWNCPRKEELSGSRLPPSDNSVRLLYHGSIGPNRLPLSILSALAKLPAGITLRVIGYETSGSRGYLDVVRSAADDLGIASRVEMLGTVSRSDMLHLSQQCDIGLALMPMSADDPNMRAMAGASNKAFDYLALGLPVIVSDLPAWRSLYVDPGYGVACNPDDPVSIERAMRSLVDDLCKMREMGERGRKRIEQEWNYETQFAEVLTLLNHEAPVTASENSEASKACSLPS